MADKAEKMTRKEFLKTAGAGLLGAAVFLKMGDTAFAATPKVSSENKVHDNLNNDAIFRSSNPPKNTNLLWHYTGKTNYTTSLASGYSYIAPGTLCYYEGGWRPVTATWA